MSSSGKKTEMMEQSIKNYLVVTAGYWAFTITDGAIRMLVVLFFYQLGYSPFEVAMLFLFYEFFGIVTNMVGGWLGSRIGLNLTMHIGMALQVFALLMLTVPADYLSVAYVMAAQALSGIAKDLNKMSAKASVKSIVKNNHDASLFKWVAILTGSKNALKGAGFFVGGFLLELYGFANSLYLLAAMLAVVLLFTIKLLPKGLGKMKNKAKFSQIFSKSSAINYLSAARFFLFGSRDVWFVVALPVFLVDKLQWRFDEVGAFFALWVMAYGFVQASAPKLLKSHHAASGQAAKWWALVLAIVPLAMVFVLSQGWSAQWVIIIGLAVYGIIFAINSALHSYLILAYSSYSNVALNVGFYYMANAGGRLAGTVLSGLIYQSYGLSGCLYWAFAFVLLSFLLSFKLPQIKNTVC